MSTTETAPTLVRVSRLQSGGWTFHVSGTRDTTVEELREVKDAVLQIAYELRDELRDTNDAEKDVEEIPF